MAASHCCSVHHLTIGALAVALGVFVSGCRQPEEPPKDGPAYRPQPVAFSNNNDVVEDPAGKAGIDSRRVVADFNLDGQDDLALLSKHADGSSEVEIFIRQSATPMDAAGVVKDNSYYRAGVINGTANGRIIGIASQRKGTYTDLRVIIETPGEDKNIHILYRNNGDGFFLVEEI